MIMEWNKKVNGILNNKNMYLFLLSLTQETTSIFNCNNYYGSPIFKSKSRICINKQQLVINIFCDEEPR